MNWSARPRLQCLCILLGAKLATIHVIEDAPEAMNAARLQDGLMAVTHAEGLAKAIGVSLLLSDFHFS